ncbi:MAG: hypothetical protein OEM67_03595 [Thermoleophilia bacterium]|nr:hypothetical protein [Thermoleophilia bacterium]MDH3724359.1 hypothetical protein [Thermoleophilia bacterium]
MHRGVPGYARSLQQRDELGFCFDLRRMTNLAFIAADDAAVR